MSLNNNFSIDSDFLLLPAQTVFSVFDQLFPDDSVLILDNSLNIKYFNERFAILSKEFIRIIPLVNQCIKEIEEYQFFISYLHPEFLDKKHILWLNNHLFHIQANEFKTESGSSIYGLRIIFDKNCSLINHFNHLLHDISESGSLHQNIYSIHQLFELLFPNQEFIYTIAKEGDVEVKEFWRNQRNEISRDYTCAELFNFLGGKMDLAIGLNVLNINALKTEYDCLTNKLAGKLGSALIYKTYILDKDIRYIIFFERHEILDTEKRMFENVCNLISTIFHKKQAELILAHSVEKEEFVRRVTDFFLWEYHHSSRSVFLNYHDIKNFGKPIIHGQISLHEFMGYFFQNDADFFKTELDKIVHAEINLLSVDLQLKPNALFNSQYARFVGGRFYDKYQKENIIVGHFQDITPQKINEIKLVQAKSKAEESDKLKSSFLANMSHEIRTPLNGILGFSRLLSSPDLEVEKRNKYLDYINKSGQNLLYLINDILDVAKIESGKFSIKIKDCLVNEMLDELHQNFIHQLGARDKLNIELKLVKGIDDEDFAIKTDPLRLRQVFNNLIGNSLKFTEFGRIVYGYTMSPDMKYIQFFVEDTGIGIPEDKIDLIFSRFGKIENGRIVNPGGTGLGLSIVKQIIEYLEGTITLKSVEGKGSRFDFKIRYKPGKKEREDVEEEDVSIDKYQSIKMLVVEDNLINQQLILDTLMTSAKNLRITIAENGAIALKKVESENFDIILMDIQMPVMDGNTATMAIRAMEDPIKSKIPIIGLSAHAIKSEADKCMSIGMNSYLTKPFMPDAVLREIAKVLNKSSMQPSYTPIVSPEKHKKMIDLTTLIQMYGDDKARLKSILNLYAEQIPPLMKELEKNLQEGDWSNSGINAHTLKGNLSYLGNDFLREYAFEIEKNAKNDKDNQKAHISFTKLKELWDKVHDEIVDYMAKS